MSAFGIEQDSVIDLALIVTAISVTKPSGEAVAIVLEASDPVTGLQALSVGDLKAKIQQIAGVAPDQQRLSLAGTLLEDGPL